MKDAERLTVAVVDDEGPVGQALALLLDHSGFAAELFPSGPSFLERLEQGASFEVLLSDVSMPEMTGTQLVRRLRELGHAMPVVFVSGVLRDLHEEELSELGVSACLSKPVPLQELATAVRQAVASSG